MLNDLSTWVCRASREISKISTPALAPPITQQTIRKNSVFAEYLVDYAQTSLALSLRRDWNQRFANATTARGSISHVLWQSSASQSRLHLSFGQGITNPSFFELFGFIPSTFIGNPELQPERSSSYDLGWAQSWEGELAGSSARWDFDLTYFSADLQNEITTVYDANFMSRPINPRNRQRPVGYRGFR